MYDGRFNTELTNDVNGILRPFALSLFHPAPKRVLMIGLASGSWAKVLANHPDLEALTIVEINPSYLRIVAERPEVSSVLSDPKVRIVIDDGRRWLMLNPGEKFDAIVQNTTWHFRANITNMLSEEFHRLIAAHLTPGGVFFYNTTGSPRVQRTGCLAMPHGLRFANHMLVSNDPIAVDFERWRAALLRYRLDGRLVLDMWREADELLIAKLMGFRRDLADESLPSERIELSICAPLIFVEGRNRGLVNVGAE